MTPQSIFDFGARHLLTQNVKCKDSHGCLCQLGPLRCAVAAFAVESNVTKYDDKNSSIPSIYIYVNHNGQGLFNLLANIHDVREPDCWPDKLAELAIKHGLQPFGPSDLSGGRGRENPLAVWYTDQSQRKKLQEVHAAASTSHLLEDYLKAWPLNTSGIL